MKDQNTWCSPIDVLIGYVLKQAWKRVDNCSTRWNEKFCQLRGINSEWMFQATNLDTRKILSFFDGKRAPDFQTEFIHGKRLKRGDNCKVFFPLFCDWSLVDVLQDYVKLNQVCYLPFKKVHHAFLGLYYLSLTKIAFIGNANVQLRACLLLLYVLCCALFFHFVSYQMMFPT